MLLLHLRGTRPGMDCAGVSRGKQMRGRKLGVTWKIFVFRERDGARAMPWGADSRLRSGGASMNRVRRQSVIAGDHAMSTA